MVLPECKLTGEDGNVFNLTGIVRETLRKAGMRKEAKEMCEEVFKAKSYDEALSIFSKYVTVC